MTLLELFILAVGLSMDAFAVSVCKGLATRKVEIRHYLTVGLWFGGFQALMPLIGFFLGSMFEEKISRYDHWVAFVLLVMIGANMIREALGDDDEKADDSFSFTTMFVLAVATSIDALTIGIMFGITPDVNIAAAISFIGVTTFLFSAAGLGIGHAFGLKYKRKAEIAGGAILIFLGFRILAEHTGFLTRFFG